MPRCRKCKKDYPDSVKVCPDDGYSFTMEQDATMMPAGLAGGGGVAPPSHAPARVTPAPISRTQSRAGMEGTAMMASGPGAAAAPSPRPQTPPVVADLEEGYIVGEYRVDKKIGEGGMGAVYSAVHPLIGKKAAIKVISAALCTDESAVDRFVQEARSVNQIGHPNIVDIFSFGMLADGRSYFAMEHLQGESLGDRVERGGLPLGEAIEILDQVADALEAAHEKRIVHRDLKPDNVFLSAVRGGRTIVKLLDFGIAKLAVDGKDGAIAKTRTGMMMGTPGYLSPEQARGKNVDHRTDIYALGCMTFEIMCGQLPFVADNAMDIVIMHMSQPPPKPSELWPEIPKELEDVILRMLEKEPANRPELREIRAVFSSMVQSGLVTLEGTRSVGFRSALMQRVATPTSGLPVPRTPVPGTMSAVAALSTSSPSVIVDDQPAKKSKVGLFAAIGAVVVIGGAAAVFAMGGGDAPEEKPKNTMAMAPAPTPPPAAPEPVKPDPVPEAKPVEPVKPQGGVIELLVDHDNATVSVDGVPVAAKDGQATIPVENSGPHTLTISAEGRKPYEVTVEVADGKTVVHKAKLARASSSGSSRGKPAKPDKPNKPGGPSAPSGDETMDIDF